MFRTALRNLTAHKLRLFATGLAVVIGVAFMTGTMVLSATMSRTFDEMFVNAYEGTDALVRSESAIEGPDGVTVRSRFDESLVATLAAVDGVSVAQPDARPLRLTPWKKEAWAFRSAATPTT